MNFLLTDTVDPPSQAWANFQYQQGCVFESKPRLIPRNTCYIPRDILILHSSIILVERKQKQTNKG
ncbi:hypothetical protein H5410_048619 [Solanum commersonii]|uniref:Uncharacterized protein n=1 Tax=Solanum commersonii TaxID=4109 RepID=A0A9J5XIM5_SOLCO|nr:hypothetical protein H5410_048619 [Solanum commersonii]